ERDKLAEPPLLTVGRLGVRAAGAARSRQLLRRLLGAMHRGSAPGVSSPDLAITTTPRHGRGVET
ncbi:MAG: hypothetical protein LC808_08205, partial [Actinobacteria bacterium]|nr:hypothetical protein [Actinomycetota bacterium]